MLPGINGFQVLRQLRATSDVPVLMLSARGEEQDKVDGLELGADDYVVKPFALRELLSRVRAAVRRRAVPSQRPPSVLYRGALRIEPGPTGGAPSSVTASCSSGRRSSACS
jgi:two-component system phosphate regulon response regulator OmpR